ncbi:MAG: glycosyl hydrolase [bacterium]
MSKKLVDGEKLSKEKFTTPSRELGILPFWFWNGDMNYKDMEEQLNQYYDQGMPGLFIHSRFGHTIPYLSEEWFDRVEFTCQKAEEIGLETWVYDEKNWPSGTAGWKVPRENPELQQRYLEMAVLDVQGPLFTYIEGTDSRYNDLEKSEPICAYAIKADEFNSEIKEIIDLTPQISFEKIIPWEAPEGHWKILYFIERRADYYIDALNPDSTEKFIELTHEKYKKHVGDYFGNVIPGFYTDEPALHYYETAEDNYIIPWSGSMFKYFKDRNNYSLRKYLPALFLNMGEETSQIRLDFWQTISEQYNKSFYQQLADWCHDNDLLFTGHLLFEDQLRYHSRNEGNIFDQLKTLDIIGVDHLYPRIGTREMPNQHIPHKIGSSAAHHFGSTRLLCESFGGTYWDVTMERMKWIADWEFVLGVNLLNPHGFHYSIEGDRKRDWPPSQFYHHTWWDKYDKFNQYITRNSYLLSGGQHVAKIAVIYPINSMWANYQPQDHNLLSELIEKDFNYLADTLLRLHFDYDYIDEKVLIEGEIKEGKLQVADEEYELILMPGCTTLKKGTVSKLKEFYQQGGKVVANALLPYENVDNERGENINLIKEVFGCDPQDIRQKFIQGQMEKDLVEHENSRGGKAVFMESPGLFKIKDEYWLDNVLKNCITPDVQIDDKEVFYLHRRKEGKEIYFFINPTDESRHINCQLEQQGYPEIWDSETGNISRLKVYDYKNGQTLFPLKLAPYESKFVVLTEKKSVPRIKKTNTAVEEIDESKVVFSTAEKKELELTAVVGQKEIEITQKVDNIAEPINLDGEWEISIQGKVGNALLINNWKVYVENSEKSKKEKNKKDFSGIDVEDSNWLDFTQGAWSMQLPEEPGQQSYPVVLWYRAGFKCEYVPEDLRVLVDGFAGDWTLYINGQEVEKNLQDSKLDAMMKELDISSQTTPGDNQIAIKLVVNSFDDGIMDPLKLVGSFSLKKGENENWIIAPPQKKVTAGSLTRQGYPYFAGTVTLEKEINLKQDLRQKKVILEANCGSDILEVEINGQQAGHCLWHPYSVEITDYLKPGKNRVVLRITNTLINLLEGKEKDYGLRNDVQLVLHNVYEWEF